MAADDDPAAGAADRASSALYRVKKQQFGALFIFGEEDDEETVEDMDAELILPNGTRWSATFLTLRAIEKVMDRWRQSGECAHGVFFQCPDLVVIPEGGLAAMLDCFQRIVDSGGPEGVLQLLDDEPSKQLITLFRLNDAIASHGDGCDTGTVAAAEGELGVAFPPSYRSLVEEFGTWDIAGDEFLGVYQTPATRPKLLGSVAETLDARSRYGMPSDLIVVMIEKMGGLVVLDSSRPDENGEYPVLLWHPGVEDRENMERLGDDFGSFALALCQQTVERRRESEGAQGGFGQQRDTQVGRPSEPVRDCAGSRSMASGTSIYRVESEQFSALFVLGAEDDEETVDNVRAELVLPNGTRWSATFMTLRAIEDAMRRRRESEELSAGVYFQCSDLVIIREGGLAAIVDCLHKILDSERPQAVFEFVGES